LFLQHSYSTAMSTHLTIEELQARRQVECEAEDHQREEEDRLFEEEVRRLAEAEEIRRQEEEAEQRQKEEEEQRRLEEAEKEYARQKEIEKARLEKWKVVEMKESGEETEKELGGSNKKVSHYYLLYSEELTRGTDKVKTGWWPDNTTL
jgi:hypothetical protein